MQNANVVIAHYSPQRIPQFAGNPLIEALPPSMTDDELIQAMTLLPDFVPEQRSWETHDRIAMLSSLQNFMVPLRNHVELARALDSMLRAGYVGRIPRTPAHAEVSQKIYANQMAGKTFTQSANTRTPQLSTALIGISGMGKTTAVTRWCAHLPRVIFHPDINLYQVPYLHVEMPSDGASVKGLAHGILQKMDELIPEGGYYDLYAARGRAGTDTLMRGVARVMHMHCVGVLICDEVQNLANAKKGGQTVMTELVSACNDLRVPILFIGTNKAARVLDVDFRQARRSSGHGIEPWDRLYPGNAGERTEWDSFLDVLWRHQWVRNPVPLDPHLAHVMYGASQGILDLAIKLFASAQARAMLDGTEQLTPALLTDVFDSQFKLMHPMVHALRSGNLEALCDFDDIAPLNLAQHLATAKRKVSMMASPLFTVKAADESFAPRLATGLAAMGYDANQAVAVAQEIAEKDGEVSLAQGVRTAVAELSTPKPARAKKRSGRVPAAPAPVDRYDARPGDYRRAIAYADAAGVPVLQQLKEFGMAPDLEEILLI
ncbi:AAA family ATPase [Castellaniella sp.]|uniref:AAA family ATPase n=1 Tax=Castellaniella sp. TaxID=1955812 RepID=UPI003C77CAD4